MEKEIASHETEKSQVILTMDGLVMNYIELYEITYNDMTI